MDYVIALQADVATDGIDRQALEATAARALDTEAVATPSELSIVLTSDAVVRELNRTYRGSHATTDVLSFAQNEGEAFARDASETPHLGDVVISVDTAREQAAAVSIPLQDELSHLLVHGILHLLGYDHDLPADAEIMRAHEDAILGEAHHH